jgi:hypothetical protein
MNAVTTNQHLARPVLWIRIRMDPHPFSNLDPHPDPHKKNPDTDLHPDPHHSDELDPDPHQFEDDKPK